MIKLYRRQRELILFLGVSAALYSFWYVLYECWIGPKDYVDTWLSETVAHAGAWVLGLLNYETAVLQTTIYVAGKPTLYIGNPCNGLVLMALFAGLITAFPGAERKKLYFIPLGVISIFLINVARVVILAINHIYSHGTVEFNHHYTFSFAVYAFIFALWLVWAKKFSHSVILD